MQYSSINYSHHAGHTSPGLIYFITGSLYLLTSFTHFTLTPHLWQPCKCSILKIQNFWKCLKGHFLDKLIRTLGLIAKCTSLIACDFSFARILFSSCSPGRFSLILQGPAQVPLDPCNCPRSILFLAWEIIVSPSGFLFRLVFSHLSLQFFLTFWLSNRL